MICVYLIDAQNSDARNRPEAPGIKLNKSIIKRGTICEQENEYQRQFKDRSTKGSNAILYATAMSSNGRLQDHCAKGSNYFLSGCQSNIIIKIGKVNLRNEIFH